MLVGRVVVDGWLVGESLHGARDEVALGRMEVSAGRVDPQRPARSARLLPRRERQRILKQLRYPAATERHRGHVPEEKGRLVTRLVLETHQIEGQHWRPGEATERIRLGRPVHVAERAGEAARVMLRSLVVREHGRKRFGRVAHGCAQ